MKRSIEWVDDLFDGSRSERVLPSEVQDLVKQVRNEAFDTFELWLHRYKVNEPTSSAFADYMLKTLQTCKEQTK